MNAMTEAEIEAAKLAFEQDKLELGERWRRRTYLWTIASGLLTAAVTMGVAWVSTNSGSQDPTSTIAVGPIEACRDSLRRLDTLALAQGQTLRDLAKAIGHHKETCDDVLVTLINETRK